MIGCKVHDRTRQDVKKEYNIYGVHVHCWCGYDLKRRYNSQRPEDPWVYELFEKTICNPEKHFSEYPKCPSTRRYVYVSGQGGWKVEYKDLPSCGLHGLTYEHCRLCKEALPGMVEGMINGVWQYSPWTIAKKIYSALRM